MPRGIYKRIKPFTIQHRLKMRIAKLGKKRLPFSSEHRRKIGLANKNTNKARGINHGKWKGGITDEQAIIRNSIEYKNWRNEVYKRDRWTCNTCKIKCLNKNIVAHHIKSFSEFPELRFGLDNGITLCRPCHRKLHIIIEKYV